MAERGLAMFPAFGNTALGVVAAERAPPVRHIRAESAVLADLGVPGRGLRCAAVCGAMSVALAAAPAARIGAARGGRAGHGGSTARTRGVHRARHRAGGRGAGRGGSGRHGTLTVVRIR
ncbi:hypothetical protein [Streptomyces sp. NPDC006267]|uniref:hypothetical protein n=1 Tax=Streptomyces sp. NPDC006267 TaxID=3157173 RepID=UPI0033A78E83